MIFDAWPNIRLDCPICHQAGCAVYRGYYQRLMACPELEVPPSPVAIRTGFCRRRHVRFSLLPDFLLRYRRLSRFSIARLIEERRRQGARIQDVIDALTADLGEEFYLPLSTAYAYLKLYLAQPP